MVKDWIASAVKPFVREAKQHFRPEAVPMVSATCLELRIVERREPDFGAWVSGKGPEVGMEGRAQAEPSSGAELRVS